MAGKILVVEDEFLSRANLCTYLGSEGYEIGDVANGREALEVLAAETFDLVITDLIMPHIDGLRLIDCVDDRWPHLPVILISGYLSLQEGAIVENKLAPVFHKPINLKDVAMAVNRILEPTT